MRSLLLTPASTHVGWVGVCSAQAMFVCMCTTALCRMCSNGYIGSLSILGGWCMVGWTEVTGLGHPTCGTPPPHAHALLSSLLPLPTNKKEKGILIDFLYCDPFLAFYPCSAFFFCHVRRLFYGLQPIHVSPSLHPSIHPSCL